MPRLIIIGAMKSGTTSLFNYLARHPQLTPCRIKEPAFFAKTNWHRGIEWYASLFPDDDTLKFEASTNYTKYPNFDHVPQRMADIIPEVRLLYIVRHPVARLRSELIHNIRAGHLSYQRVRTQSFWENEATFHIGCSRYYWQLEQYFPYFGKERICVIALEELSSHPQQTMDRVLRFLDLPAGFFADHTFEMYNTAGRRSVRAAFRRLRAPRGIQNFTLTDEQQQQVWEACVDDLEKLETLIGRKLHYQPPVSKSTGD
ncbi:MAG: sulfotransferase [Saprospiraceae bacterium]|nr:sulfotransferase [Saprospiraceae bacterium]